MFQGLIHDLLLISNSDRITELTITGFELQEIKVKMNGVFLTCSTVAVITYYAIEIPLAGYIRDTNIVATLNNQK